MFFHLFKRKISTTALLDGAFELHCHVIPAVDDGVQRPKKAYEALQHYADFGYQGVVFTPHIMADWPKNGPEFLIPKLEEMKKLAPAGLELKLAGEYMLDHLFLEHLKRGDLLSYDGKHVLVETSYMAPSPIMDEQFYELRLKEYQPILAHPERYVYMRKKHYMRLKRKGVLFQLNLLSLMGAYGGGAKEKAEMLLKEGMYDFVGLDTHQPKWMKRGLERFRASRATYKLLAPLFENSIDLAKGKLK